MPAKPDPEFGRERFGHGFGHRFIENRTVDPAVDDAAEALPDRSRTPDCFDLALFVGLKPYSQSVQIVLPAKKTARL